MRMIIVVIARCGIQCMRGICHKDVGELSRDDDWMQRKGREEENENEKGGKVYHELLAEAPEPLPLGTPTSGLNPAPLAPLLPASK